MVVELSPRLTGGRVELVVGVLGNALVDERTRDADVRLHLGEFVAHGLEVGERAAEGLQVWSGGAMEVPCVWRSVRAHQERLNGRQRWTKGGRTMPQSDCVPLIIASSELGDGSAMQCMP